MEATNDIATRWRALARRYPVWRMPLDLTLDLDSWRMIGADLVSFMVRNKKVRTAAAVLEGASEETLRALSAVAAVNVDRSGEIFKIVLLTYVSLPLAFLAMLSEAAPDAIRALIENSSTEIVIFLIGSIAFPVIYFCGAWRAKQIAWTIELYRNGAITPLPPQVR